jgi:hypothetical protein
VRQRVNALSHMTHCKRVYSTQILDAAPVNETLWNKSRTRKVLISAIRAGLYRVGCVAVEFS